MRRRLAMPYVLSADDDHVAPPVDPLQAQVARILELAEQERRARQITMIVAGVGAVFAAARLGIVAIPWIRRVRS